MTTECENDINCVKSLYLDFFLPHICDDNGAFFCQLITNVYTDNPITFTPRQSVFCQQRGKKSVKLLYE